MNGFRHKEDSKKCLGRQRRHGRCLSHWSLVLLPPLHSSLPAHQSPGAAPMADSFQSSTASPLPIDHASRISQPPCPRHCSCLLFSPRAQPHTPTPNTECSDLCSLHRTVYNLDISQIDTQNLLPAYMLQGIQKTPYQPLPLRKRSQLRERGKAQRSSRERTFPASSRPLWQGELRRKGFCGRRMLE